MGLNNPEPKLLHKYNIPIRALDYGHIQKCENVNELEKILLILRSGEEGIFPDLIKFCEDRLHDLCPSNKYLTTASNKSLSIAEKKAVQSDLQQWEQEIKECETRISGTSVKDLLPGSSAIPVRQTEDMKHNSEIENEDGQKKRLKVKGKGDSNQNSFKRPVSSSKHQSYSDWDKFDVEKELEKLDQSGSEKNKSSLKISAESKAMEPFIDTTGMSEQECKIVAEQERLKGNEAFKAQDYAEAEVFYSRSISCYPLVAALNNRAITNIKLKKFTSALYDCNAVLNLEADNVKALYRRGLVYKETSRTQLAYADFQQVLELDPKNKAVKEQIKSIEDNPFGLKEKSNVIIEEVFTDKSSQIPPQDNVTKSSQPIQSSLTSSQNKKECQEKSLASKSNDNTSVMKRETSLESSNYQSCQIQSTSSSLRSDTNYVAYDKSLSKDKKLINIDVESCECETKTTNNDNVTCDTESFSESCEGISKDSSVISHNISEDRLKKLKTFSSAHEIKTGLQIPELSYNPLSEVNETVTPFKFLSLWHSTKADKDSNIGAALLKKIPPVRFPEVISNKLDGDFLTQFIQAVSVIVQEGEVQKGYEYMFYLTKTPRIRTICSFLSEEECKSVNSLLMQFEAIGKDISVLQDTLIS